METHLYWVPIYCGFNLVANTCITIDKGTNRKELAGSLSWVSHDMRSCVTKLPVLAILASTGSIPRNTDEYLTDGCIPGSQLFQS